MNTEFNTTDIASVAAAPSAEAAPENNPAFQRRDEAATTISPEGTAEPAPLPTNPSASPKRAHRPHRSKIAALPTAVRDFINESIHDHVPQKQIIQALTEKGHPGITPANLTKWTKSGYELWLKERESLECLRLKVDDAGKHIRHIASKCANDPNRLNGLLIDIKMTQALRDFDDKLLKDQLLKDPLHFFKIVRATHARALDRHRDERLDIIRDKIGEDAHAGSRRNFVSEV